MLAVECGSSRRGASALHHWPMPPSLNYILEYLIILWIWLFCLLVRSKLHKYSSSNMSRLGPSLQQQITIFSTLFWKIMLNSNGAKMHSCLQIFMYTHIEPIMCRNMCLWCWTWEIEFHHMHNSIMRERKQNKCKLNILGFFQRKLL